MKQKLPDISKEIWQLGMRNGANACTITARDGGEGENAIYKDTYIASVYEIPLHTDVSELKVLTKERERYALGLARGLLIAAAPKLLQAAIWNRDALDLNEVDFYRTHGFNKEHVMAKTRMAINEATGV